MAARHGPLRTTIWPANRCPAPGIGSSVILGMKSARRSVNDERHNGGAVSSSRQRGHAMANDAAMQGSRYHTAVSRCLHPKENLGRYERGWRETTHGEKCILSHHHTSVAPWCLRPWYKSDLDRNDRCPQVPAPVHPTTYSQCPVHGSHAWLRAAPTPMTRSPANGSTLLACHRPARLIQVVIAARRHFFLWRAAVLHCVFCRQIRLMFSSASCSITQSAIPTFRTFLPLLFHRPVCLERS